MQTTTTTPAKYVMVLISRRMEGNVIIKMPDGQDYPTDPQIREAIEKTMMPPEEWDSIVTTYGKRIPMDAEDAEEFNFYDPASRPTFEKRAVEIGITTVSLRKWRAAGVDVFDDEAVKAHVVKQRNYNPKIASKFQARLSD